MSKNVKDIKVSERYKEKYRHIEDDRFTLCPPFPKDYMTMEVTNRCNNDCIFCFHHKMTRPQKDIEPELANRIIEEAYELGMREIGFSKSGEPFLCNELDNYIKKASDLGYNYIYLTTNGLLVTPERLKSAVEAGLNSIKFSINAISKEDYQFVHGVKGGVFDLVYNNLKDAYEYRKKCNKDFKIFVSYVETKYTIKSRQEIMDVFAPYCDEVLIVAAWNLGGYNPEVRTELSTTEMDVDYDSSRKVPCPIPFNAVTITVEGYLTACCLECQNYLAVADLHHMSLEDAWFCDTFQKFRKMQIDKQIKGYSCENCVANARVKPLPLTDNLYSDFDYEHMFNGAQVKNRINKFLHE